MPTILRFLKSTILSKVVMAATGCILVLFILGHMAGNLQMYSGQDKMNTYAATLQSLGSLLWVVRLVMFTSAVLHIWTSLRLKLLNLASRPVPYVRKNWVRATIASRTMLLSGSMIGCFLVYHLMHFTLGTTNPEHFHYLDPMGRHDVFSMVVLGYQNVLISGTYIAGMILLGFHLNHAIGSTFQTLGVSHPRYTPLIEKGGIILSFIIVIGFISVPTGVLLGLIKLPVGVL